MHDYTASIVEIVTPLIRHGGCASAFPSEDDRLNDVAGVINPRAESNWALFTPSFIGTLQPETIHGLKTLVLAGEPISAEMRDTWASRVQLSPYAYGMSEISTIRSVARVYPDSADS